MRILPPDEEVLRRTDAGASIQSIADRFQVTRQAVSASRRRAGGEPMGKPIEESVLDEAAARYRDGGVSLYVAALGVGISAEVLRGDI